MLAQLARITAGVPRQVPFRIATTSVSWVRSAGLRPLGLRPLGLPKSARGSGHCHRPRGHSTATGQEEGRLSDGQDCSDLAEQLVSLTERADRLGARLTQEELARLANQAGASQDLRLTRRKFLQFSQRRWELEQEKEAFLAAIEDPAVSAARQSDSRKAISGMAGWLLPTVGYLGTASYSIAGTQVAGEAGMNVVGCLFVGGVSALGGGAVNALLYGYAAHGVPWAKDCPRNKNLLVALLASLATFLLWPVICRSLVEERVRSIQDITKSRTWWTSALVQAGLGSPIDGVTRQV